MKQQPNGAGNKHAKKIENIKDERSTKNFNLEISIKKKKTHGTLQVCIPGMVLLPKDRTMATSVGGAIPHLVGGSSTTSSKASSNKSRILQ